MQAILIRHGRTPGNDERRYIGRTDESLSEKGRAEAEQAQKNFDLKFVYVSPLIRARETAAILFPNAEQVVLPGLRETDFGIFEGKNADEMVDDAEYRAWVDGMCLGTCPGGESREDVTRRAVEAFMEVMRAEINQVEAICAETDRTETNCAGADCAEKSRVSQGNAAEDDPVVFVTHGGVIMSILEALAEPHRDYYDYYTPNLGGWIVTCTEEDRRIILHDPQRILLINE